MCEAYLQEVGFENNQSDHETWSIWCHVGIHVDFTFVLVRAEAGIPDIPMHLQELALEIVE
jgi:hypothetical protein